MIVRMEESRVVAGRVEEFCARLRATVLPRLADHDGFLGADLYRSYDGAERVVLVTRWRDEAALDRVAGPGWPDSPLAAPAVRQLLARPPHVWHFVPA